MSNKIFHHSIGTDPDGNERHRMHAVSICENDPSHAPCGGNECEWYGEGGYDGWLRRKFDLSTDGKAIDIGRVPAAIARSDSHGKS